MPEQPFEYIEREVEQEVKLTVNAFWEKIADYQSEHLRLQGEIEMLKGKIEDIAAQRDDEARKANNLWLALTECQKEVETTRTLNKMLIKNKCGSSGVFNRGDRVRKKSGSEWQGTVCGEYSTKLTPEGYAVESEAHAGSVQIYPAKALESVK